MRTIGTYQVFRDGAAAMEPLLSGTTAEAKGPSSNALSAKAKQRIAAGTYALKKSDGPQYVTDGYRADMLIAPGMPGLELSGTGARSDILIHPGKNRFLSSIGCINLCTRLPNADEDIDFIGSRRRVIALIDDLMRFLGDAFPKSDGAIIPNAVVIIEDDLA